MNPFRRPATTDQPRAELPPLQPSGVDNVATLRLYDPIDSWGGEWGVSAKEFVAVIDGLPKETAQIRLMINSPGGEVWEGLAILNALRNHPAKVVAVVEGIAASAASFIAAGVDELHVMKNSEVFVHKAWGIAIGNADDLTKLATDLNHLDRNLASIYADKAGGTADEWLVTMAAETWYSAEEAVKAGLADRVIDTEKNGAAEAKNRFDLSIFAHAGREAAPKPANLPEHRAHKTPAESPVNPPTTEGADMSDTLISGLRERLGFNAELKDEGAILAAVDQALAERAEPTTSIPEGTALVDKVTLADLQAKAEQGVKAYAKQQADHRTNVVQAAVADGRIPPARADYWTNLLALDPGAEESLGSLAKGSAVPVALIGHGEDTDTGNIDAEVAAFSAAFGLKGA